MKTIQIMVVEDENIVAMEITDRLKAMGYQVCKVVSSGEAALIYAGQLQPDLILMDVMIKGEMDGIEAAARIRHDFHIPIIYLTAYADEATLQRAKITEPFGYIIKPFVERELYTSIEMALYKHKMDLRLKENEQWLATTLRSISDAVITTDENGIIKFLNPVAEKMLGQTWPPASGLPLNSILNLMDERTRAPILPPFENLLQPADLNEFTNSKILKAADGKERIIAESTSPLRNESGEILGYVLVFRDITEKRKLENDLLKAQKLESIGVLAGGIAHDFNNILTAVIGNLSLAKADARPGEELYVLLKEAEQAALQAKNLTQQLLTFSKGGAPMKKVVSIRELIKSTTEFTLRGSNLIPEFNLPADIWAVEIDVIQISQVIQNVVLNAKQAMSAGGKLRIQSENVMISSQSNLPLKSGKYLKITFEDSGIGIPRELLPKIFDPYFTTKDQESGLGLAICYSILKKHGGHIRIESQVGVGTTVFLFLPATTKAMISQETAPPKIEVKQGKILLMDDEDFIRKIAARMLSRFGFEVVTVNHGAEALEQFLLARQHGKPFDAVILDLTIRGGLGGKETMCQLREIDPEVKAFVSSGYSNDPILSEYQKFGFLGAITKPYKLQELEDALKLLRRHQTRQESS